MRPAISIIIPHLREPENDKALRVALDCIIDNTDIDYELIVEAVSERRDIYPILNDMTARAKADWIVYGNSDVFFAPGWASAFYKARDPLAIVTGVIAECGAIPVNDLNHAVNFGRMPETFDREAFELWVRVNGAGVFEQKAHNPRGWYFPCLLHKRIFLDFGGFDTKRGSFPDDPIDKYTWDNWAEWGGYFARANSWCYHLQNYSTDDPSRIYDRLHRA